MDLMAKKTYKAWTSKEDYLLQDMRNNGSPVGVMAEILGRTPSSVTNRIANLGLKKTKTFIPMTSNAYSPPEQKVPWWKKIFS
tara:strand:+ start:249 stop:497 length:249 start_codon:yes stop_codon:yes gene_type:complete